MLHLFVNTESSKDPNIIYLSGYNPGFCILIYDDITKRKCMFVSDFEVSMYSKIKTFAFNRETLKSKIISYFRIKKLEKMGVNYMCISLYLSKRLKKLLSVQFVNNSMHFSKIRIKKSPNELKNIKKACQITDKIYKQLYLTRKKFRTEKDIYNFIKLCIIKYGVEPAFDPVVATSKNSAEPHHIAGNIKLKGFTIIDFGVKYNGYCSDMTRVFFYGKPKKGDLELYNQVLTVYSKCILNIRTNRQVKKVDKIARDILGKNFLHSLGHGLGVEIHERPNLSIFSKDVFENNMVFTIEPGIYFSGKYGIRFEDTFLLKGNNCINLTKSSNKMVVID
ncbi:MAG: M24 family metallopeptidase [Candidatus Woesearchaeota archaeon]